MEEIVLISTGTDDNDDEDKEDLIKDVMLITTKADISTINIIPGITLEEEETLGRPPSNDSR